MILGLGMDLVSVARVERSLSRFGGRLLGRVLTPGERAAMPSAVSAQAAYVASRFAVKEAAVKALGTGFGKGVAPRDVETVALPGGKPELRLHGAAARKAERLGVRAAHVSLSHERDVAGAVVILEG